MNTDQLATVITATDRAINECHQRAYDAARKTESAMLEMANEMVRCGKLLGERRKQVKHGEWVKMFSSGHGKRCENATYHFDHSRGHRYMSLARRHPDPFASWLDAHPFMVEAGIISGLLKAPEGHGKQQRHAFSVLAFAEETLAEFRETWKKHDLQALLPTLSEEGRRQALDSFREVKEFAERAMSMLE